MPKVPEPPFPLAYFAVTIRKPPVSVQNWRFFAVWFWFCGPSLELPGTGGSNTVSVPEFWILNQPTVPKWRLQFHLNLTILVQNRNRRLGLQLTARTVNLGHLYHACLLNVDNTLSWCLINEFHFLNILLTSSHLRCSSFLF